MGTSDWATEILHLQAKQGFKIDSDIGMIYLGTDFICLLSRRRRPLFHGLASSWFSALVSRFLRDRFACFPLSSDPISAVICPMSWPKNELTIHVQNCIFTSFMLWQKISFPLKNFLGNSENLHLEREGELLFWNWYWCLSSQRSTIAMPFYFQLSTLTLTFGTVQKCRKNKTEP